MVLDSSLSNAFEMISLLGYGRTFFRHVSRPVVEVGGVYGGFPPPPDSREAKYHGRGGCGTAKGRSRRFPSRFPPLLRTSHAWWCSTTSLMIKAAAAVAAMLEILLWRFGNRSPTWSGVC
ncbi:hypothetical protein RHMOL_Rhmol04G0012100 [Rhododendron molle]|uniref:Uncharacterized protein n=1 Tax=Rhododendron molle TaxID=49168 RepID=A0ACC0NVU4_RHOML|nr:hypothetical protein RHMOL_Rhmol04G0012100 [Rhododendron molle]